MKGPDHSGHMISLFFLRDSRLEIKEVLLRGILGLSELDIVM